VISSKPFVPEVPDIADFTVVGVKVLAAQRKLLPSS
jgi:hypothetical protein